MTWSYNPIQTDRDKVRFLVGDTDNTSQKISDEEITYVLTERGDVRFAAAMCARAIAASFAALVSKQVGDLRISYAERQKHYLDLAKQLEMDGSISAASPFAGAISQADKETREQDTDRVVPAIERDQFDNPDVKNPNKPIWDGL